MTSELGGGYGGGMGVSYMTFLWTENGVKIKQSINGSGGGWILLIKSQ